MLTRDIINQEINIGDEVIIWRDSNYKCLLVKETQSSVAYKIWGVNSGEWIDAIYWIRKHSTPYNCMYKI